MDEPGIGELLHRIGGEALAVGLEPVIAALWLRLLLVSGVYLGTGALLVGYFMKRLRGDIPSKPDRAAHHAQRAAREVAEEVKDG